MALACRRSPAACTSPAANTPDLGFTPMIWRLVERRKQASGGQLPAIEASRIAHRGRPILRALQPRCASTGPCRPRAAGDRNRRRGVDLRRHDAVSERSGNEAVVDPLARGIVSPSSSRCPAATHASTNPVNRLRRPYLRRPGPTTRSYSGACQSKLKSPIRIASAGIGGMPPSVQPASGSGWPPHHAPPSPGAREWIASSASTCGSRVAASR